MWWIVGTVMGVAGAATVAAMCGRAIPRVVRRSSEESPPRESTASRELALKERLLVERLTRRLRGLGSRVGRRTSAAMRGWEQKLERGYRRLRLLAQEYVTPTEAPKAVSCDAHIAAADAASAQEAYDEAEEHLLACLKLDPKHRDAYVGLALLYRRRKELTLAEETLRFLRKLVPEDDTVAAMLAEVLREREKVGAALKEIQTAIALAPRNPRYLDFAVDCAIVERNRRLATRFLEQLREANPENQKLGEFEERIAAIEK